MSESIPNNLRTGRKLAGMTLKQVSEKTGLSISFLSDIERGVTEPSLATLRKLSKCYRQRITIVIDEWESIYE